jgi:dihydrofolate synthase/folylpolyglutamate synthase
MKQLIALEAQINNFLSETKIFVTGDQKLARMRDLMQALGNPEQNLKIIHVAGTSGKTSTCYYIASLLQKAGYSTGLTISPFVDNVRERAMLDLKLLPEAEYYAEIKLFFDLVQKTKIIPSYFEFYLAFAFWLFAKKQVDYAVIETGLGGAYDASNVAQQKNKVCVITDIGFDHTEILGETLPEIALGKAGIIHQGNVCFMHWQPEKITWVIEGTCRDIDAKLFISPSPAALCGLHGFRARNASLALRTVEYVVDSRLSDKIVKNALKIKIPARAEEFTYHNKKIIIDCSHNPQKLSSLIDLIRLEHEGAKVGILASFGENKSATLEDSLYILRRLSDKIFFTSFRDTTIETAFRLSIPLETMRQSAKTAGFQTISSDSNPAKALENLLAQDFDIYLVTGSFYLLNHLRPLLLKAQI